MIKSIKLAYFRKHEQLSLDLTEGLQVFRGVNEIGKTSILESVSYSLFGAKALRNSLAETVTWGHKESELKVELTLEVNGQPYRFCRSKAGAEVYVGVDTKPYVTGQTECSTFSADLLGADAKSAAHLMLSGQGSLRGILEQGPQAASILIESLSNMQLIDDILEKATEKLQLGNTAISEERLKVAEDALANTTVPPAPAQIDLVKMAAEEAMLQAEVEVAKKANDEAWAAYEAELKKRESSVALKSELDLISGQIRDAEVSRVAARAEVVAPPDVAYHQQNLDNAMNWQARTNAYGAFLRTAQPDFTLPAATFPAMEKRLTAEVTTLRTAIATHKATVAALTPQVTTTHTCPACGQDTAHLEEVKQKQAQLQADLTAAQDALDKAEAALPEARENVEEAVAMRVMDDAMSRAVRAIGAYVTVDESTIPKRMVWNGDVPDTEVGPDVQAYQVRLNNAKSAVKAIDAARAKVLAIEDMQMGLGTKMGVVSEKIQALALLPEPAFTSLGTEFSSKAEALTHAEGALAMAQICQDVSRTQYAEALQAYDQASATLKTLEATVTQLKGDITRTQFNNNLLKRLRAARPIIANKLWSLVLATVSTLFTQMRGETSIVSKGKDGFTVNGKPVESLSGSTLDCLGLAIRVALTRTFIPNCPFLILDEATAACDKERTETMLGFIASSGFQQVILVTHEDASESLAANLIQL